MNQFQLPASPDLWMPWFIAHEAITITMKYNTRLRVKRTKATDFDPPEAILKQQWSSFKANKKTWIVVFPLQV